MGRWARLDGAETLASLGLALRGFEVDAQGHLSEARSAIGQTETLLADRRGDCERAVDAATTALDSCQSVEDADCGEEAAALDRARARLDAIRDAIERFAAAVGRFESSAPLLSSLIEQRMPAARGWLDGKADVVSGSYAGPGIGSAAGSTSASRSSGGTPAAAGAPPIASFNVGGAAFSDVPLSLIENPTFQPGEFAQADIADIMRSFGALPGIRAAIANGTIGALIQQNPNARRVYDFFFRGEAVKLGWHNGQYTITNGKHRVAVAQRLGLKTIPAII